MTEKEADLNTVMAGDTFVWASVGDEVEVGVYKSTFSLLSAEDELVILRVGGESTKITHEALATISEVWMHLSDLAYAGNLHDVKTHVFEYSNEYLISAEGGKLEAHHRRNSMPSVGVMVKGGKTTMRVMLRNGNGSYFTEDVDFLPELVDIFTDYLDRDGS